MITTLIGLLTAIASALIFFAGALLAWGMLPYAFALAAIGAGWLGILQGFLLRNLRT